MNARSLDDDDYHGLPEDDEECFLVIESRCRANAEQLIQENEQNNDLSRLAMLNYMAVISASARECNVADLSYEASNNIWSEYEHFSREIQGIIARLKIRRRKKITSADSVQLTMNAKSKIEFYISKLRRVIADSDLNDLQKKILDTKLDNLLQDVNSPKRLNLGKVMVVLATVTTLMTGVTTMAADGPEAIQNIMRLIGAEKQTEDDAVQRLAPPPKLLTASVEAKNQAALGSFGRAPSRQLDDDIPF